MAQQPTSPPGPGENHGSALDREADRLRRMTSASAGEHAANEDDGLDAPAQGEQDNRNDKARADARAAGGGSDAPAGGLNRDG